MSLAVPTAVWAVYVFAIHTFIGQRRVAAPLARGADVPLFARATLEVVWHACSWNLLLGAGVLVCHAVSPQPWLVRFFALQAAGIAALFLWLGPRRLGSGFALPQWILVGPLALAMAGFDGPPRLVATLLLAALSLLHFAWAFGMTWPAASARTMPPYVIGWPEGDRFPSRGPTLTVAIVLAGLAVGLWLEVPMIRWLVVAIFVGRGLYGLVEKRIRPAIATTPYAVLSLAFYSPLCLFIGALAGANT